MRTAMRTVSVSEVQLALADPSNEADITAAVALGNRARDTLGFMPVGGYRAAAARQGLLLAREGDNVVGYALFAVAHGRVRLTHLCVEQGHRRRGIARAMVDWISERHRDLAGILVRCRHDYGLGDVWIALGFSQLSEAPGRSRERRAVVRWWRDHGHPNLFTRPPETVLVRASVDLNVLRDLTDASRPEAPASLALVGDQLSDRLELVRTPALDAEIDRLPADLRGPCIREAERLASRRGSQTDVADLRQALLAAARLAHPEFPENDRDEQDLRHVAESIAAGVTVFTTHDVRLMKTLGPAAEEHGLRILHPADVIVHIDELVRAEAYRPAALLRTSLQQRLIGTGQERQLGVLATAREKPSALEKRARGLAASGVDRVGVFAERDDLLAAFASVTERGVLTVPLLRVANGAHADTLARQLLFMLRERARDAGAAVIRITDPCSSPQVVLAAASDGFLKDAGGYYAFVIDVAGNAAEVAHRAVQAADLASVPRPAALRPHLPAPVAAEIERLWWPAKILDSSVPTYVVPIQQSFSVDLLGKPEGLLLRETGLGLSRERVYYRSAAGPQPKAPARVLWYMSGSRGRGLLPAGVIACSHLDEVVTGSASALHSRFRHLGVWSIRQIEEAARGGQVQALSFANTELFPRTIGLRRLRALGALHGEHTTPQAPVEISTDLFTALYQEGRGV